MPDQIPVTMTETSLAKTGVLLVNLGTPDSPDAPAVRRYLREFLSDPRVLDISPIGRFALLWGIILPLRPARAAKAYKLIWEEAGSPLLSNTEALTGGVADALGDIPVEFAMRYGKPSLREGLQRLQAAGCDELVIFPLYPHYASSSTGSTIEAIHKLCSEAWNTPFIRVVPPFFDDSVFIEACASVARPLLKSFAPDHVLFSYHGLPVRQVMKSATEDAQCGTEDGGCCDTLRMTNRLCYRAQCMQTTRLLVLALGLKQDEYSSSFQSRLGRAPWIQPFTDRVVPALAQGGSKRLAVICPSFVADCLETIEEIGIRARQSFLEAGGQELVLVPSLNSTPVWIAAATELVRKRL